VAYACQNVIPCASVENVVESVNLFLGTVIKLHFGVHDVTSQCNILL
jgi:hypothetical protein